MSIRKLAAYDDLAFGTVDRDVVERPIIADNQAPAIVIPKVFNFQSYFDSTLLQNALLVQSPSEPIVRSTLEANNVSGYALGLHPSSQTPVAVQFDAANGIGSSATYILKPGQVLRPVGQPGSAKAFNFSGFRWGLPFGWLGGGLATLYVFQTPDATVEWHDDAEVIFHRVRVPILIPANVTVAANNNARKNWPLRFPWVNAIQGTNLITQQGRSIVGIVRPTRVAMRLQGLTSLSTLNYNVTRFVFSGTNDFSYTSAGAVDLTNGLYDDITWPAFTQAGTNGNLFTGQVPGLIMSGLVDRLAADDGGLAIIDVSTVIGTGAATTPFSGAYIDFVRYGKI